MLPCQDQLRTMDRQVANTAPLQAISSGDIEMCRSQLFAARSNVVQQLAMLCSESASHINPAVLQLQQLQCLQDAWEYRHPQLRLHPADQAQVSTGSANVCVL